jgi:small-conductance mechanosensitive channel
VASGDPAERASRAVDRIEELPLNVKPEEIELHPGNLENKDGVGFLYRGKMLFFISSEDIDKEGGDTLDSVSKQALGTLHEALRAREEGRKWPTFRRGVTLSLIGFALFVAFVWLVWQAHGFVCRVVRSQQHRFPAKLRLFGLDLLPHITALMYAALRAAAWLITLSAVYIWLSFALHRFPYTEPWGRQMGGHVIEFFQGLAISVVDALPGIFACAVIFVMTRWIVRLGRAFFLQVANGRVRIAHFDPDVARATERIFTFVMWIFAVVVAFPYIPGSSTDAFRGISVFFGLVVSLGSTGIINQVMSGLFVVYSKALKVGEWVVVEEIEGEVLEVGLLAAKVRTIDHQEVTVPNSVLVSNSTRNFTRLGQADGMAVSCRVTLAYDAPWRQVHALLRLAAERTPNIRKQPSPYVLQRALSDVCVEYALIARLLNEKLRTETMSELHANIQDAFNEFGVQIMLPHMDMTAHNTVFVPRSKWYSAPATPERDPAPPAIGEFRHLDFVEPDDRDFGDSR